MVHIGKWNNKTITVSQKNNSLTISIETVKETQVFSFDKAGRLWTALLNKISYRRGLNGNVVAKWNSDRDILHRKWLNEQDKSNLLSKAHSTTQMILDSLLIKDYFLPPLTANTKSELIHLAKVSEDFYQDDIKDYLSIYKPVGILPPDQYISVVLQLTEGCSFNKCTFCTFYRDRQFRIKQKQEFENHINRVINFIGDGLSLRRTIFLGDANALVIPTNKLIPLIEVIHRHLDVEKLGGLFAFLDGFSGEKKNLHDYNNLFQLGLKKIYIGLESGNNQLLKFLNKPGTAKEALNTVRLIKSAGISVGIIILLGAGGKQYQEVHIAHTVDIINQMELDADDLIYFSELIESEGLAYTQNAFNTNLIPLSSADTQLQRKFIEENLIFSDRGTPHISTYDIRDFVY